MTNELFGSASSSEAATGPLLQKIKTLNSRLWEDQVSLPRLTQWLNNFSGRTLPQQDEQMHALHLLSHFMYFGVRETREMLRSLYRDEFRTPLIHSIRLQHSNSLDPNVVEKAYRKELASTLFCAMGASSESGEHLLYYFRQENALSKALFTNESKLLDTSGLIRFDPQKIKRLILLDDFAGSGDQALTYSQTMLRSIKQQANLEVRYVVMMASKEAVLRIREESLFDQVNTVFTLDDSFRALSEGSRYYRPPVSFNRVDARTLCQYYGNLLLPTHPLGRSRGEFLLGFNHNTPNNTLPIFWSDKENPPWIPVFRRHGKRT